MKSTRVFNFFVALSLILAATLNIQPAAAQNAPVPANTETGHEGQFVPGEIVVGFVGKQSASAYGAQASALAGEVSAQVVGLNGNVALLSFAEDADVETLAAQIASTVGVSYAEPNYIYSVPQMIPDVANDSFQTKYVVRNAPKGSNEFGGKEQFAISMQALQSMRRKAGNRILATYPNDPYLWWNNGWDWVGSSTLVGNATTSAGICELDTGVDYLHKDLSAKIVKGYDFVNGDVDPMDDNGHGTHVAGIMAAASNNKEGISGVSTGKVVAVKVLDAQGWGTNFDIASGINFCAARTDVKVINLSLGGTSQSTAIYNALNNAVNNPVIAKRKLVVAAAGNDHVDEPNYPAFFGNNDLSGSAACAPTCPTYPSLSGKVLAVAASGHFYQDPPDPDPEANQQLDNNCQASHWAGDPDDYFSNYGSWVSVVAPGSSIYSSTPWDKPFYMNQFYDVSTRYSWLDGTSMASPFVAAAAARRWGYKPLDTNVQVADAVINSGMEVNADGTCWDTSMTGKRHVNVAVLLDRGAANATIFDASTGLTLTGASLMIYQGATLRGTGIIMPDTWTDTNDPDPLRVFMSFPITADVVNLPVGSGYVAKVNKTGYTASPQVVFQSAGLENIYPGSWEWAGRALIPPKSKNFDAVVGWWVQDRSDLSPTIPTIVPWPKHDDPDYSFWDLDVNVWLPDTPNPLDPGQPAKFIVGLEGNDFGFLEGEPMGAMTAFPFARLKREGGATDRARNEDITIAARAAHAPLAANAALPYYAGTYTVMVTDYGQTFDHDADGCGDNYGPDFDPAYDPTSDPDCPPADGTGTLGISLMGVYYQPWVQIWKDGLVKKFVMMDMVEPGNSCNVSWWKAMSISSGASGTPAYTEINTCGDGSIAPYAELPFGGAAK